jgi:formate-dependent nitrite reductase cytochrome c552 subunit
VSEDDIEMEEMKEDEDFEEPAARKAFKEKCFKKYTGKKITSPLKAIHEKCYECSGDQWNEVRQCVVYNCALYPFRFGKNPFRTIRNLTEEQKQASAERLAKYRAEKSTTQ